MSSSTTSALNPGQNVQDLNNIAQKIASKEGKRLEDIFQWDTRRFGRQDNPEWTAVAYFKGEEYGRGSATRILNAKAIAAEQAIPKLRTEYPAECGEEMGGGGGEVEGGEEKGEESEEGEGGNEEEEKAEGGEEA